MSEWISVEDKLPDKIDACLTSFDTGGVWISIFMTNRKIWIDTDGKDLDIKVTHWMPLPEPPDDTTI